MERNNQNKTKSNGMFTINKITKVWLPLLLVIFVTFNIPLFPSSVVNNENINFQPAASFGELPFFPANQSNNNGDVNWIILLLIFAVILFFLYFFIFKKKLREGTNNRRSNEEYSELLNDETEYFEHL